MAVRAITTGALARLAAFFCAALLLVPAAEAAELTYAHVWSSAPPARPQNAGYAGQVQIIAGSRAETEGACGAFHDPSGWMRSACSLTSPAACIIYIANDVPRGAAWDNLITHERAHCAGWENDHRGARKPPGHLDNCLATRLPLEVIADLCMLNGGTPLQGNEAERWREIWQAHLRG